MLSSQSKPQAVGNRDILQTMKTWLNDEPRKNIERWNIRIRPYD